MSGDQQLRKVAGVDLHVRVVGTGQPVLLINGLAAHTAMWAPLERHLQGMELISFDAPGVGDSPRMRRFPSVPELAAIVATLLDDLGHDRVDLLGYSFGGAVAQQFAHAYPQRVRRMVLVATTVGSGGVLGEWRSVSQAFNPLRYYSEGYYERSVGVVAGGQARRDPEFRRRLVAERLAKRPRPGTYYAQIASLSKWSSLRWLHDITTPTLVVTGDDDPLVPPANSFMLASRLSTARLVVTHGDGHLLLLDDDSPAHVAIRDFLLAATVEQSTAWEHGLDVNKDAARAAVRERGRGPILWGPLNAAIRRRRLRP